MTPTPPRPFALAAPPAPAGRRAPDRLDGPLAVAVMQRAVLARRTTSPHANVLEFDSTAQAREVMGVQGFAQFQRWLLNDADLAPILRIDPAPKRQFLVTSLMNRFADSDIAYIKNVLNKLAKPPLSIEQVVMLTPPRADYLLSYAADPKLLKVASEELESVKERSPLPSRPLTAQESGDATNEVAAAKLKMQALAPYNYDRALQAKAQLRAGGEADKTFAADAASAATIKKVALKDADDEVKRATDELMKGEQLPANKPTPTSRARVKRWLDKEKREKDKIAEKLKEAQDEAATAERDAIVAAQSRKPASQAAASKQIEEFVMRATATTSEEDAAWIGDTSGLCLALAEAMLGAFVALKDPAKARVATAWLAATYPEAAGELAKGSALITELVSAGIEPSLAIKVSEVLLPVTLGAGGRTRLAALIAAAPGDWVDVCAFVTTYYSRGGDQASKTLEQARALGLPVSMLAMFGGQAHTIVDFQQQHPSYDLVAKAPWMLDVLATRRHKIDVLCELAWETRALSEDKARLLVVDCADDLLVLRAGDATQYGQVLDAAARIAIDKHADELHWYRVWLVDHQQAFASSAVLVAGLPTVAERIELIEALKVPQLVASLLAARAVGGARWRAVADIVKTRASSLALRQSLGDALTAITTHYAAAADELIALLPRYPFANVGRATVHASNVAAPETYITWQLEQYTGVDANVYFLAHVNAWHEYLSKDGAGLVTARTVTATKQKFISGSTTDVLHVFTVSFTLAGGAVTAELHNHVDLPTGRQRSLHYKNSASKGRELQLGATSLSQACERAVAATPNVCEIGGVNQFARGYKL